MKVTFLKHFALEVWVSIYAYPKIGKMLNKPLISSIFPSRLINSIKHEHLCKLLYKSNYTYSCPVVNYRTAFELNLGVLNAPCLC